VCCDRESVESSSFQVVDVAAGVQAGFEQQRECASECLPAMSDREAISVSAHGESFAITCRRSKTPSSVSPQALR
jgi:hypothetical protein